MNRFATFTCTVLAICILAPVSGSAQDNTKQEHDQMRGDHRAAAVEHMAWMAQLGKMRVEHRQALAALARLRAEILAHEAEIEAMAEHIRMHEMEMKRHDQAMHDHEAHGEGHQHDELKSGHTDIMTRHNALKERIESEAAHHDGLIQGILNFSREHMKKFHSGQGEHRDHDHDHDHED